MFRQKIHNLMLRNSRLQYPLYWLVGVYKQLKNLFLTRNIGYTGSQPFLFIVGAGRSGNTLLRKLLMETADIYIPPESYVLGQEVVSQLDASALRWCDKVDLTLSKFEYYPEFSTFEIETLRDFAICAKAFSKEKQQVGTLIIELYRWIAKRKGYSTVWLGDKTPLNTMCLGLIRRLIPNASYVYIERDGIDACYSYVQAGIYDDISEAAHRWKDSRIAWNAFKKTIPQKSYIEIKYESMVEKHESSIDSILDWLKIPVSRRVGGITDDMGDVSMRRHHSNVKNSPNKDSVGKGRSLVSVQERIVLRSIIGNELVKAGYKPI